MDLNTDFSYMTNEELDELISRIKEAKERRSESRKAKYMGAIRKAFEDYFENVGPIEVTFGYEDADGMEGAATIEVNSDNPPCFCQQSIEFP